MGLNYIKRLFENHSVCVVGMKGSGKDLLTGNIIARRKLPYISNCDYGYDYHKWDYDRIVPRASFKDIVSGRVPRYEFPYEPDTDIYLSDVGVYFPSQYCSDLNKLYPNLPIFMALSRHWSTKIFCNCQNLNRIWDKIREHSDYYIYCEGVIKPLVKLGIVVQSVIVYDKYQSCVDRVKPCRVKSRPLASSEANATTDTYLDNFYNQHGSVRRHILIYINKSKHDTHFFKEFFKNGGFNREK